jgi:hypothetical protein
MPQEGSQSPKNEVSDTAEAIEQYYSRGWTDGLPVVPPTEASIRAMLDAAGLGPRDEVVFIEHRRVSVTAHKAAINAVMAGCRPEYMPVVVAGLQAMADPAFGFHGPATSTGGAAMLLMVNGPMGRELEINGGEDLFGPGWRANATIGRAVRLILRNVVGCLPGALDRSTLGHPGRYTFCFAENEVESPWPPFHVERGYGPQQSTVTVFAALAPHQFYNQLSNTAEGVLTTACAHMRVSGGAGMQPQYMLVLAGEHARVIARDGWSKADIRRFCFERSRLSHAELKRMHVMPGEVAPEDETTLRPLVAEPDDVLVVAGGGRAGAFSAYIPGWGGKRTSQSVTREIRRPG